MSFLHVDSKEHEVLGHSWVPGMSSPSPQHLVCLCCSMCSIIANRLLCVHFEIRYSDLQSAKPEPPLIWVGVGSRKLGFGLRYCKSSVGLMKYLGAYWLDI